MVRIEKSMLSILLFIISLLGMYVWYKSYPFYIGPMYYVARAILFAILFVIAVLVHKINTNRYHRVKKQFQQAMENNKEVTSLYNKIEISEKKVKHLAYHDHLTGLPNRLFILLSMILEQNILV